MWIVLMVFVRKLLYENRVQQRGGENRRRKLHNEELLNLYCSPNIVTVIVSRKMRGAGYVARMGEMKNSYKIQWEQLKTN